MLYIGVIVQIFSFIHLDKTPLNSGRLLGCARTHEPLRAYGPTTVTVRNENVIVSLTKYLTQFPLKSG